MNRGGKHWRSIFGILLLEALGTPARLYEMLMAVCVELPHTGSLMIDDIEDRSAKRRSQACIHNRYGQDVAINAANALYFVPYLLVQNYPYLSEPQRHEIYQIMSNNYLRAHFGQGLDIYWSNRMSAKNLAVWNNSIRTKILQSYALKTASLVVGLAEIACVIASADAGTCRACAAMAKLFGVAFQITDDVLNFSDSGKPKGGSGEDLANGKMTYVIHRALERLTGDSRKRLQTILCSPTLRGETEVLGEGIELIRSSGALAQCRQEARDLLEEGWRILSGRVPASEPKTLLRALCAGLVGMSDGQ
jgi:geranylgeranyl pyrophosphate synthase